MNICERDLVRAVKVFMAQARIPRPAIWSHSADELFLQSRIYPAFLAALQEIETVNLCYGFSLETIMDKHNEQSS